MSLLTIIQKSCRLLNLPVPTVVVTSTDPQVQQLWELANEEGYELAGSFDWQALRQQYTFVTIASAVQASALAADMDHFISNSFFNRTTQRNVYGPITPQQWQAIQAQPQLNRVFLSFVERDGQFLITPTPAAGETIAYEYISSYWAKTSGGVAKAEFTLDSDETYLSERVIILGVRWRFLKSKGLDYAEDFRTYMTERAQTQARDGGATVIDVGGRNPYNFFANIPDGNYPG